MKITATATSQKVALGLLKKGYRFLPACLFSLLALGMILLLRTNKAALAAARTAGVLVLFSLSCGERVTRDSSPILERPVTVGLESGGRYYWRVTGVGMGDETAEPRLSELRMFSRAINNGDLDSDGDGHLNGEDNCPVAFNPFQGNGNGDTVGNVCDNCPTVANPSQTNIYYTSFCIFSLL